MSNTLRLTFSKTGRARFISHLDLMRVFQRAFYRAELPLRYTQGFNPHVILSIALPLSVGQAGLCEILDLGIDEAKGSIDLAALPERLNGLLPEGISVLSAEQNGRTVKEVVWARYTLLFQTRETPESFLSLFSAPLVVEKRTKKGSQPTDLLPMIRSYACTQEGSGLLAVMELAAQNPTLNADYIAGAFRERFGPDILVDITRTALLDAAGEAYRCGLQPPQIAL